MLPYSSSVIRSPSRGSQRRSTFLITVVYSFEGTDVGTRSSGYTISDLNGSSAIFNTLEISIVGYPIGIRHSLYKPSSLVETDKQYTRLYVPEENWIDITNGPCPVH